MQNTSIITGAGRILGTVCVAVACLFPVASDASTVFRSDETINVGTDQLVEGNFYTIGGTIGISGEVQGDWLSIGNSVTGNGTFTEDVHAVGRSVQLHGSTTDDVRIVALEATIAGEVGGDVVVVANSVEIMSSANITGDLLVYANEVEINGPVGGDVLGRANSLRVDSSVGGGLDVTVEQLTLGSRADVGGAIAYASNNPLDRAQDAVVAGDITQTEIAIDTSVQSTVERILMPFLAVTFAVLVAYLLLPKSLLRIVTYTKRRLSLTVLLGFVIALGSPFIVLIFLFSGIGVIIGLFLLALYLLAILAGVIAAGPLLGSYVGQWLLGRQQIDIITIGIGVTLLHAVLLVPVVGLGLYVALVFAGTGGAVMLLYQKRG